MIIFIKESKIFLYDLLEDGRILGKHRFFNSAIDNIYGKHTTICLVIIVDNKMYYDVLNFSAFEWKYRRKRAKTTSRKHSKKLELKFILKGQSTLINVIKLMSNVFKIYFHGVNCQNI